MSWLLAVDAPEVALPWMPSVEVSVDEFAADGKEPLIDWLIESTSISRLFEWLIAWLIDFAICSFVMVLIIKKDSFRLNFFVIPIRNLSIIFTKFILFFTGLKTALIEADDFGSGTSSRSTKLIHGGVRYLQKAIFNLDIEQVETGVTNFSRETFHIKNLTGGYSFSTKWWKKPWPNAPISSTLLLISRNPYQLCYPYIGMCFLVQFSSFMLLFHAKLLMESNFSKMSVRIGSIFF